MTGVPFGQAQQASFHAKSGCMNTAEIQACGN